MNQQIDWTLLEAIQIMNIKYIDINEADGEPELHSKENPEVIAMRTDLENSLSEDAKFILNTILDSPKEMVNLLLTEKRKKISHYGIRKWLAGLGWSEKDIHYTLDELKTFNMEIKECR